MQLNPLHDRVVVKRIDADKQTASGIIIPETTSEKPDQGKVIAVGPGKRNSDGAFIPMSVSYGDKVLFGKFAGQTVKIKGEELLILEESRSEEHTSELQSH